jgi:hypothetical protein
MEKASKLAKIILWALMIVSIALFVILVTSIENETNPGARAESMISLSINWAIILVVVGGVAAVAFAVIQMLGDKKQAVTTLLILLGFGLIILVSYALSSSEIPKFFGVEKFVADGSLTPAISRWIGTGLVTTYILFATAALSIVAFGAASLFKRS